MEAMGARNAIAGPAGAAAPYPVTTKFPAPMAMPTAVRVRLVAPKLRPELRVLSFAAPGSPVQSPKGPKPDGQKT